MWRTSRRFGEDLRECGDDTGRGLLSGVGKVHRTCSEWNPRQYCVWLPGPALHQVSRIQTLYSCGSRVGPPTSVLLICCLLIFSQKLYLSLRYLTERNFLPTITRAHTYINTPWHTRTVRERERERERNSAMEI